MRRCEEFPRKGRERRREKRKEKERERERGGGETGRRRRMKRHVGKVAREGRRGCRLIADRGQLQTSFKVSFQIPRFCVCIRDANATAQRRHIAGRDRLAGGGGSKCRFWLLKEDESKEREREKVLTVRSNVESDRRRTRDNPHVMDAAGHSVEYSRRTQLRDNDTHTRHTLVTRLCS